MERYTLNTDRKRISQVLHRLYCCGLSALIGGGALPGPGVVRCQVRERVRQYEIFGKNPRFSFASVMGWDVCSAQRPKSTVW